SLCSLSFSGSPKLSPCVARHHPSSPYIPLWSLNPIDPHALFQAYPKGHLPLHIYERLRGAVYCIAIP
ncbi:MAG: hypothetical protein V1709_10660, partial [Planctomycetota bacterium]